jgi:hypothetical protein
MIPEELVDILKKPHHFVAGRFNLGQRATLKNAQVRGLKFPKIVLQGAILAGANRSHCVLSEADLSFSDQFCADCRSLTYSARTFHAQICVAQFCKAPICSRPITVPGR